MIIPISSNDDHRLDVYRDLPKANLTSLSAKFIVEGRLLVERLANSTFPVESVVVDEKRFHFLPRNLSAEVPVYVLPAGRVEQLIGFNFHRGILACGRRIKRQELPSRSSSLSQREIFVVCVDVQDPTNLGGILRNGAAFGARKVFLTPQCADPFSRRVLRVSMGAVFQLQLVQSTDLMSDLRILRDQHHVELLATVLDKTAENLRTASRRERMALLFGNEGHGLPAPWIAFCQRRITLPMANGTDSLNAAAASAVFLYHFTHVADGEKPSSATPAG